MNKPLYDFEVYFTRLLYASVCTKLPPKEAEHKLNAACPTGLDHGWKLANEPFRDGAPNGHACENNPKTHKHYLFVC